MNITFRVAIAWQLVQDAAVANWDFMAVVRRYSSATGVPCHETLALFISETLFVR
jgi:hypothetical protein